MDTLGLDSGFSLSHMGEPWLPGEMRLPDLGQGYTGCVWDIILGQKTRNLPKTTEVMPKRRQRPSGMGSWDKLSAEKNIGERLKLNGPKHTKYIENIGAHMVLKNERKLIGQFWRLLEEPFVIL